MGNIQSRSSGDITTQPSQIENSLAITPIPLTNQAPAGTSQTNNNNIKSRSHYSTFDEVWMRMILGTKHPIAHSIPTRHGRMMRLELPLITEENYHEYTWESIQTEQNVKDALNRLGFVEKENRCLYKEMPANYYVFQLPQKVQGYLQMRQLNNRNYAAGRINKRDHVEYESSEDFEIEPTTPKISLKDKFQTYGSKSSDCRIL